jgi:hypothetical protein
MGGGLLQLVAIGSKDAPLTLNPEITFFKILYKKHTNFAIQQTIKNLGEKSFNTFNTYKLEKNGDLLLGMHYKINIPKFEIINPTVDISLVFSIINLNITKINNWNSAISLEWIITNLEKKN